MELRLPELSWRPRGDRPGHARAPRSASRSARTATAWVLLNASPEIRQQIEEFPGLHPRGPRHSPIERDRAHQRRPRPHARSALAARVASARRLRDRERRAADSPRATCLYRTLERFPGQVTWRALELGPRGGAGRRRTGAPAASSIEPVPVPGKLPIHLEGLSPPDPEDNVGLAHPRGVHRAPARLLPGGGRRHPGRAGRAGRRRLRLLRRHVLVERRAARARPRRQARGGHGAPARRRRGREPGRPARACAPPAASTSTSTTRTRSCATTRPSGRPSRRRAGRSPGTAWR